MSHKTKKGHAESVGVRIFYPKGTKDRQKFMERTIMPSRFPFQVSMPCGQRFYLMSLSNIPTRDLRCSCGNPDHWVVVWEEVEA